jgi:hypothetical protein
MPDHQEDGTVRIPVRTGFQTRKYTMSKPDEYRTNAQECQRMAGISRNPSEKAVWRQMAQDWLRMIGKAEPSKSEQTECAVQTKTEK